MSEKKDTNPKDAVGVAKVPFSTVPAQVVAEVGLAMLEGALKYGRHNYRVSGVRASVYYDALQRHMTRYWEGEDIDPDSGLSNITIAIACLTVLRDAELNGMLNDDRPPVRLPTTEFFDSLNARAKALLDKYPNPKTAHTNGSSAQESRSGTDNGASQNTPGPSAPIVAPAFPQRPHTEDTRIVFLRSGKDAFGPSEF